MDSRLLLWILFAFMVAIVSMTLIGKITDAYEDKTFIKKYLSSDLALMQDALMITDSNAQIEYILDPFRDEYIFNFKECEVEVKDIEDQSPERFLCADDFSIQKQDQELNQPSKIVIIKNQNQIIRQT